MNILGISGSRRRNGNTAELIEATMSPFRESDRFSTEIIYPGNLNIQGCTGCEKCAVSNRCVIQDDMQDIHTKLRNADAIIAGSPTYFYNLSSDMKKFIDRCYCFFSFHENDRSSWISEFETGKKKFASLISVCEQNDLGDMGLTPEAMRLAFQSLGFRIVSNHKVLHAFRPGDAGRSEETLSAARNYGERLMRTLLLSREN